MLYPTASYELEAQLFVELVSSSSIVSLYSAVIRKKYFNLKKNIWIMERKQTSGFRRIFTLAILLFLAPSRSSNPTGQSITLKLPNLTNLSKATVKIRRNPLLSFLSMIQSFFYKSFSKSIVKYLLIQYCFCKC